MSVLPVKEAWKAYRSGRIAQSLGFFRKAATMFGDKNFSLLIEIIERKVRDGGGAQMASKTLKIAAIMDTFTATCFAPECDLLQLSPENWHQEIDVHNPDILFVESAWAGKDGLWKTKISNADRELQELTAYCRSQFIPSVFWNKEDPVHFETFLSAASLVDYVFTTDIDCVAKYKKRLGHERVWLLPFAAQPALHNPLEKYERKDAFNFAGSYYLKYPERQKDFSVLIDAAETFAPVEIYDRNFGNDHPHYKFPDRYQRYILGGLSFNEIDKAYKGYKYGININTIKNSQSMFARRVYELLASNTVIISNFSRGLRLLFGDLVISSDNRAELQRCIANIRNDEVCYRKFRLLGLRKVLSEHTYKHRLDSICQHIFPFSASLRRRQATPVFLVARPTSTSEKNSVLQHWKRQHYGTCYLLLIGDKRVQEGENIHCFSSSDECITFLQSCPKQALVGWLAPEHYYGTQYVTDLALCASWCDASAFGKGSSGFSVGS